MAMNLGLALRALRSIHSRQEAGPAHRRKRRAFCRQPLVESLEARQLLATLYVDDAADYQITNDIGPGGLSAGDTVTFDPAGTTRHGGPVTGLTFGTDAFTSIQAAVDAADASNGVDTIRVGPGTFAESVNVDEQVILLGNQFNVDAQDGRVGADETIVTGVGNNGETPFNLTASDVVLNGFTIEGATDDNNLGFGVVLGAGTSGSEIRNNIIQDNIAGLSLANASTTNQTIISGNLFQNNNEAGPVTGTAIYTDQSNAGGALNNVLIDNNTFDNNQNAAVLIGPDDANSPATNITISNNVMTDNGNAVSLFNTHDSAITGNDIRGSLFSQIVLGGGNDGISITNNFIEDGLARGIRIGDFGGGGTNQNVNINFNSIQGNAGAGIEIDSAAGAFTGQLNAENNFFGSESGPTSPDNPNGTGDEIVDPSNQIDFIPFLPSGEDAEPNTPGFQPILANPLDCEITTLNVPGDFGTATIEVDADNPLEDVLIITGTNGKDVIVVAPQPRSAGNINVVRNGRVIVTLISTEVPRIVIFGLAGADSITVSPALRQSATIFGDDGNDVIVGGSGDDEIDGGAGRDTIIANNGADTVCGGDGNDVINGGNGADTLGGDDGNDTINGGTGDDVVVGGEGNDTLDGAVGNDRVYGQAGRDRLFGGVGNSILVGGDGNDTLTARSGRNILIGGTGLDTLTGGPFDDILIGGSTLHDEDDAALQAILAEWTSGNSYDERVANIRDGSGTPGGGENGAFYFDDATVTDDGERDTLFGGGGRDWFWAGDNDRLRDRRNNEQVN